MSKEPHERLKVVPFKNPSGATAWRITGMLPDGSRMRRNFKSKSEALVELADLEDELAGMPAQRRPQRTLLTAEQISDAETAFQAAGSRQLSRIVSHYLDLETRAAAKGTDLDQAFAFFEGHYRSEITEASILCAREAFINSRVGLAPKTVEFYASCTKHLLKPDPNKLLHQFTLRDIEAVLGRFTNINSKRSTQRGLVVFFNWAVRHSHLLENPCGRLDKLPKPGTKIAILQPQEIQRLLKAAVDYRDSQMVPVVAIALFAGLRPSEIMGLRPKDINGERIRVTGGKMRREQNRRVPVPHNLASWLECYPFVGIPTGMSYRMKVLKAATRAESWVADILRHTSISYQAERDKNEGLTAFNNGTSKEMMDRHYRDVIDDAEVVEAYWNLTPSVLANAKIEVELPGGTKTDWPPRSTLEKMVWERPMIHAARGLGVSDVTLRKHCVGLGIKLPPKGYWLRR